jgi:drug/metabolite transporter (DMT)-like permease
MGWLWHADLVSQTNLASPLSTKPRALDWALLAVLVVLWGSAYAMVHIGVEVLPPAILVSARLAIGALVLGLGTWAIKARLPAWTDVRAWGALAVIGIIGTMLPFLLISTAQKTVPSALAAIYIAAAPLVVSVLCHFLVPGERMTSRRAVGILIGFGGVCLLFGPSLLDHSIGAAPLWSQVLLLVAAGLYGATSVLVRLASPNLHPVAMAFGFITLSAVFSLPMSIAAWPEGGVHLEGRHIAAILALGALATGIANLLYVHTIRRIGPIFMSNVGNLAPFWSIMLGALAFGEALPATTFLALVVLLLGVWLVQRPAPARRVALDDATTSARKI